MILSSKITSKHKVRLFIAVILFSGYSSLALAQKTFYSDSISVNFFLLDECRICQYYGPLLMEYHSEYSSREIQFRGYFPNFSSKKPAIAVYKEKHSITFDLKTDYFKKQSRRYELEVLPTVVIYDEKHKQVLYQGRIDNRFYGVGKQRQVTSSYDLKEALEAIVSQQPIKEKSTTAIGCFINFADNISSTR